MPALGSALQGPKPNLGSYRDEETALQALVDKLVRGLRPQAVYLFGSRAEGRARPDSDFDLVIVLDDSAPDDATTYEAVYAPICGSGIGCDVVPCRTAELEAVLHDPMNPWHRSWRNARMFYERG